MRVFVTGATGFVGSAVVQELINSGHHVTGLARSEANATALAAAGAEVHRGDLENLETLRSGAAASDGVIHTGFVHDFANFQASCEIDRRAIEALGTALMGSNRPLIVTSGIALITPGRVATEESVSMFTSREVARVASEEITFSLAAQGVHASLVRLPPSVHGSGDHGFLPTLISIARDKGASAYIGDGSNCWSAVHRLDAAQLFRLALEKDSSGSTYHGVAEQGIAFREIAEVIGSRLTLPVVGKTPEEAASHFTWFSRFAGLDCPATSKLTQEDLGWQPTQIGLIADLRLFKLFRGIAKSGEHRIPRRGQEVLTASWLEIRMTDKINEPYSLLTIVHVCENCGAAFTYSQVPEDVTVTGIIECPACACVGRLHVEVRETTESFN